MGTLLIKDGLLINRGKKEVKDIFVKDGIIEKVDNNIDRLADKTINAHGMWVLPGIIDDQVHFREPGLTHKANIQTESKAAAAGGVTTFMEMPNTKPSALTQELLQDKYDIAAKTAWTNYSFFMGASNENIEEVLKTDPKTVCGVKVFMGSSTGNMLVDNEMTLNNIFSKVDMLIATHCEDEATVRANRAEYMDKYGQNLNATYHPIIRDVEACYLSSSLASEMAKKHDTRLHILHITTAKELELFRNDIPLSEKRITSEVCVHHLYFDADDYLQLGNKIICNPAIKEKSNKAALFEALLDDRLDIIATDHAPHTIEEKSKHYLEAPSGLPLIQHTLNIMLDFFWKGKISLEKIVEKMCHAPAECFQVSKRGYLDEGYFGDIVIVDPGRDWEISKSNLFYKCGWSPLEGLRMKSKITHTIVNGVLVYHEGQHLEQCAGQRVTFDR